ncbi:MAG: universal stress protein [Betaproteobacteria bacterium]
MTVIVAYAPRPEGKAALEKAIEIAARRKEKLIVVNASPGGAHEDKTMLLGFDVDELEEFLLSCGADAEFKQFVRGKNAVEEIEDLVDATNASLLIIGLRKRSLVGKLLLGSVTQEILLTVKCPVLCVKAN